MDFKKPVVVYTAVTNVEAHLVVDLLESKGIAAMAVEDNSGVSLWQFGTLTQFHQPNVFVDQADAEQARQWIAAYEDVRNDQRAVTDEAIEIEVVCEECGKSSWFAGSLDGTIQECAHCYATVDVGELPWEEDFGEPED